MSMTDTTSGEDIDLSKLSQLGDGLLEQINRIREREPVFWSEASRCWFITRHQDVTDGFANKLPLSSLQFPDGYYRFFPKEELEQRIPTMLRYLGRMSVNLDPPDHTRVRMLLVKAFSKGVIDRLRPFVRDFVQEVLDDVGGQPAIEFNEDIARRIPGAVILRMLGLPDSDRAKLRVWSNAFLQALGSGVPTWAALDELERVVIEMNGYFEAALEERRRAPRDDLITDLLNASEGGQKLSHEELMAQLHMTIVAGHESTTSSLTLGLAALAKHPDQWKRLQDNPELIPNAVLEIMRVSAMSAAQQRTAAKDFEWHGKQIKKGDYVILLIAGANRDPRVFSDPEAMDVERNNSASMTFGPGAHFCVGHMLARMQMNDFFAALVASYESVELLDKQIWFQPQLVFRAVEKLNVRLLPRSSHAPEARSLNRNDLQLPRSA